MSQNATKEIREIVRQLKGRGIEVEQLQNGHFRTVTDPPVTLACSPSDTNAARAARREIKKVLGIDLTAPPARKKGTADDWHLDRLRSRTITQMSRGASESDLARMALCANEDKNIGGWTNHNSASVGISAFLRGGRLMRANHDTLAAALSKLESAAEPHIFERHLNEAAERLGQKRLRSHHKPTESLHSAPKEPGGKEAVEVAAEGRPTSIPQALTVTIRVEIDPDTRAWITGLFSNVGVQVFAGEA